MQTEVEGVDNENVGFYGRCALHATQPICKSDYPVDTEAGCLEEEKLACVRTEVLSLRVLNFFVLVSV